MIKKRVKCYVALTFIFPILCHQKDLKMSIPLQVRDFTMSMTTMPQHNKCQCTASGAISSCNYNQLCVSIKYYVHLFHAYPS